MSSWTFQLGCLTWFRYRVSIQHPLGFFIGTPTGRCWYREPMFFQVFQWEKLGTMGECPRYIPPFVYGSYLDVHGSDRN